jgi:hypothetical protein
MEPTFECPVCFDSFTEAVYYTTDGETWLQHKYCLNCLKDIKDGAWRMYIDNIKKADCERSLKTCLQHGIPDKLTVDSTLIMPVMQALKVNNEVISTKLDMTISDEELAKLNADFKRIYDGMTGSDVLDYIGEIKVALEKFNL